MATKQLARSFDGHYVELGGTTETVTGQKDASVSAILSSFLDEVNYEAMGDFFLTYRSYVSASDLLDRLLGRYQACSSTFGASASATRVRIFVGLRHWVLNYFVDDFLLSSELRRCLSDFLRSLGGVGADEITTEARISKELNKIWDRECLTNGLSSPDAPFNAEESEPKGISDDSDMIRSRTPWLKVSSANTSSPLQPVNTNKQNTTDHGVKRVFKGLKRTFNRQNSSRNPTLPAIIENDSVDLLFTLATPELRTIYTPQNCSSANTPLTVHETSSSCFRSSADLSDQVESSKSSPSIPHERRSLAPTVGSAANDTPIVPSPQLQAKTSPGIHVLKRRPGGDLAKAKTMSELEVVRNSVDTFISRASFRPYLALWEVPLELRASTESAKAADSKSVHRPLYNPLEIDDFVRNLLVMFEAEEEKEEGESQALDSTLDKLEGRITAKRSLPQEGINVTGSKNVEGLNITGAMNPEKRQRHSKTVEFQEMIHPPVEKVLDDADSFVLPFEDRIVTTPAIGSSKQAFVTLEPPTTESIVEALAIPSCAVTSFGSIWLSPVQHRPFVLDHNPAHIAQQLTVLESRIFMELDWLELCSSSWLTSTSEVLEERSWDNAVNKQVSGLSTIVARFNLSVQWVISEIVLSTVLSTRVQTLMKFIEVAQLCRTYNNYTTVVQIVMALQHPFVRKLKRTWRYIGKSSLKTLKDLETLVMPLNTWSLLRSMQEKQLMSVEGQVVPFLGPYLSELLSLETSIPSLDMRTRMTKTASIVKVLLRMLDRCDGERFEIVPELMEKCIWIRSLDEEEMSVCVSNCM